MPFLAAIAGLAMPAMFRCTIPASSWTTAFFLLARASLPASSRSALPREPVEKPFGGVPLFGLKSPFLRPGPRSSNGARAQRLSSLGRRPTAERLGGDGREHGAMLGASRAQNLPFAEQ